MPASSRRCLLGVGDLKLADLGAEIGQDRRILAAVVERRAREHAPHIIEHGVEGERRRHDAARGREVHSLDELPADLLDPSESRHVGLGVADLVHAVDVLQEGGELGDRVLHGREPVIVETPREVPQRALLQVLEDAVADTRLLRHFRDVEFRAQAPQVVGDELAPPHRLGIGEIVPLAVIRSLHAELRLQERAVLEVALEDFLEEGAEPFILGRGPRERRNEQEDCAGGGDRAAEQCRHRALQVLNAFHASDFRAFSQRRRSRAPGDSSQRAAHLRINGG